MADNHNVPYWVNYVSKQNSNVLYSFLDPENICLDSSFAVLCAQIKIL